jgi:ornithine cyclodeaminase/alanine dehydrogenase-like protein (mu-crystallin family)
MTSRRPTSADTEPPAASAVPAAETPSIPFIGPARLSELLPVGDAVDALERAFGRVEDTIVPQRSHVEIPGGTLLLMPSASPIGAGVKLVTVNPSNPGRGLPLINGVYALFDPHTLEATAVFDGGGLTGLRTAAVSGLATRFMARPDAHRLVIFGAGVQATAHLDAMASVRPVREVVIVSRTQSRAEGLVDRARGAGMDATAGKPESVAGADIVCTCTTSNEPLFDGSLLAPGTHVNAVGAFEPHARELDDTTMQNARIVVEERAAALEEAGDLITPMQSGAITPESIVADLAECVAGVEARTDPEQITVFKSVGLALEDLAVAVAAVERMGEPA